MTGREDPPGGRSAGARGRTRAELAGPEAERRVGGARVAWAALALLVAAPVVASLFVPWRTVATVDERTYLEMTQAVAERGLPRFSNGAVERYPALQARWNLARDGELWGALAPGYPYLAAPVFRAGGVRALIRLDVALLGLLALGVYALARELLPGAGLAVATAALALLAVPVWTASFGVSSYSLAIAAITWAVACGVRSTREGEKISLSAAALAGLLAALGTAAHLLVLPMLVGLLAALAWKSRRAAVVAALGAAPPLVLVAALNRLRFGSWNPASDGPCVWRGCPEAGGDPQAVGEMLAFAAPVIVWLAALAGLLRWARRSSRLRGLVLLAGGATLVLAAPLREAAWRYATLAWGLLVDVDSLPLGPEFRPTADGVGNFIGPYVIKSTLQSAPALLPAALAMRWWGGRARGASGQPTVAPGDPRVVFPVLALFAALVLRANMPLDFAIGHPFLSLRYVMPAAPLLALLAVAAVWRLDWRPRHLLLGLAVALGLIAWLAPVAHDLSLLRRLVLLRIPLVLAIVAASSVYAARTAGRSWRRLAPWVVAAAFGWSAGVTLGVDLAATLRFRQRVDRHVERLAAATPARLALVGRPDELDAPLSLRASRDVEYLDLGELEDPADAAGPIGWWQEEGRPVFLLFKPGTEAPVSPWPGVTVAPLDPSLGLARLSAAPAADVR